MYQTADGARCSIRMWVWRNGKAHVAGPVHVSWRTSKTKHQCLGSKVDNTVLSDRRRRFLEDAVFCFCVKSCLMIRMSACLLHDTGRRLVISLDTNNATSQYFTRWYSRHSTLSCRGCSYMKELRDIEAQTCVTWTMLLRSVSCL